MTLQKGFSAVLVLIIVVITALGGAYYLKANNTQLNGTNENVKFPGIGKIKEGHPKVEGALYQIVKSKSAGEVQVVIELIDSSYKLPREFGREELRSDNLLQAVILTDKILELADNPNVKFMRLPLRPITD